MTSIQGSSIQVLASSLASAFVHSSWNGNCLVNCAADVLGKRQSWISKCVDRLLAKFSSRPRRRVLADFLANDSGFRKAFYKHKLTMRYGLAQHPLFSPSPFAESLKLPRLSTVDELAEWVGLSIPQLEWYADSRGICNKVESSRLTHYRYRVLQKRFGAVRLIEAPKPRLKALQRHILDGILVHVPTHRAAQGFFRGATIKTFAAPHVNQRFVLKLDLQDFFPTIASARVNVLFRSLGYPECIADLRTSLCTKVVRKSIWDDFVLPAHASLQYSQIQSSIRRYGRRHLPQGAPTSPVLSNLCALRLDCRLAALTNSVGAAYTRYADDLTFSGGDDFRRSSKRFYYLASSIALDEGYQSISARLASCLSRSNSRW